MEVTYLLNGFQPEVIPYTVSDQQSIGATLPATPSIYPRSYFSHNQDVSLRVSESASSWS